MNILPFYSRSTAKKFDVKMYRWLKFNGRKLSFTVRGSDRHEYDLEFEKGEKLGIKLRGKKVYLLTADDFSVQFALSPADFAKILKSSVPYEGKIGRYTVLPFADKEKHKLKNRKDAFGRIELRTASSVFSRVIYDPQTNTLFVEFRNGAVWQYADVTYAEAQDFENAESQGRYYNSFIKDEKDGTRLTEIPSGTVESSTAAEYKGKRVLLERPFRLPKGSKKKFGVYVNSDKGNTIFVKFGDPDMSIKRNDPDRQKAFMSRHKCSEKKDKTTPGYWSCRSWEKSADWV